MLMMEPYSFPRALRPYIEFYRWPEFWKTNQFKYAEADRTWYFDRGVIRMYVY